MLYYQLSDHELAILFHKTYFQDRRLPHFDVNRSFISQSYGHRPQQNMAIFLLQIGSMSLQKYCVQRSHRNMTISSCKNYFCEMNQINLQHLNLVSIDSHDVLQSAGRWCGLWCVQTDPHARFSRVLERK